MNTGILNKYDIEFRIVSDSDGDKTLDVSQKIPTDLNYFISSYFLAMSPEIFLEDILPEINKALNGQPFNKEGGGFMTFLTIGTSISSFKSSNAVAGTATIPTQDIRDVIQAWCDWITDNNLEKNLGS